MLKTIIIDDEAKSIKTIELIIKEFCRNITIVGKANSAIDGIKEIQNKKPDLVFLDIEMPHGNGFDLLESIPERDFDVIFVTAYNHYAVKAFKFSAIDYILKPIDIEELVNAVKKVEESRKEHPKSYPDYNALLENIRSASPCKLTIPTLEGLEYINIKNIIRIEADRSYSEIYLKEGKKLIVSKSLAEIENLLDDKNFFRTHKSHLINLDHVNKFLRIDGGSVEMIDGSIVIVSRRKKDDFNDTMAKFIK
ncbi:MAG: LytTR family DNA-binding domain-containing protein [Bacteroidota bacterium]